MRMRPGCIPRTREKDRTEKRFRISADAERQNRERKTEMLENKTGID